MNLRPLGYEPNELPDCSIPRCKKLVAEKEGFEPPRRLPDLLVFKTSPFSQTWVFLHNGASGRTWTGTWFNSRRILSPVRLPIPPLRQAPIMSNITGLLNCIIKLIIFQVFFLFSSNFYTKKQIKTHITASLLTKWCPVCDLNAWPFD